MLKPIVYSAPTWGLPYELELHSINSLERGKVVKVSAKAVCHTNSGKTKVYDPANLYQFIRFV
jgi:hypothetical protein